MSRDPRFFLQDILESVTKVFSYTDGMTQPPLPPHGSAE